MSEPEHKVVIYGSRTLGERANQRVFVCLDYIFYHLREYYLVDSFTVVTGMAKGADLAGYEYAKNFAKLPYKEFPADWDKLGMQAGFIRNIAMAEEDGLVNGIMFWDGKSRGTEHMSIQLTNRGIGIIAVNFSSYKDEFGDWIVDDMKLDRKTLPGARL